MRFKNKLKTKNMKSNTKQVSCVACRHPRTFGAFWTAYTRDRKWGASSGQRTPLIEIAQEVARKQHKVVHVFYKDQTQVLTIEPNRG